MSLRVSNLRLPVDEPEAEIGRHVARTLGVLPNDLAGWRILRKALDTRDKRNLQFVYNIEASVEGSGVSKD